MPTVQVITDSSAELDEETIDALGIVVMPVRLRVGGELLTDGAALRTAEHHRRMVKAHAQSRVELPSAGEYAEAYQRRLGQTAEAVAIHASGELLGMARVAFQARAQLGSRHRLQIFDSRYLSWPLGWLVREAGRLARAGASAEEIVRLVRGVVPRLYLGFYVESYEPLRRSGVLDQPVRPTIGTQNVRPLLIVEEGCVVPVQRMRGRGTVVERLFEFATEFMGLDRLVVVHSGIAPEAGELLPQLVEALGAERVGEHIYGGAFGALIGPRALGVAALEAPLRPL